MSALHSLKNTKSENGRIRSRARRSQLLSKVGGAILAVSAISVAVGVPGPAIRVGAAERDFAWVVQSRGTGSNATGNGLAIDSVGNSYATGWYAGTEDFAGDGIGGQGDLTTVGGAMFLVSYSPSGSFRWVKGLSGSGFDPGTGLAVDSSNNVLVTGSYGGTMDFAGDGIGGLGDVTAIGSNDIYVAKYTSSGQLTWVKSFGGTANDSGWEGAVTSDSSNNIYVHTMFMGTADFAGDGIGGLGDLTVVGDKDAVVMKLTPNGAMTWAKRIGGTSTEWGQEVAVDSSGNVLVSGGSRSTTTDFAGDGIGGSGDVVMKGNYDPYYAKYNSLGVLQWAISTGGTGSDWGSSIEPGPDGTVIALCQCTGTFDPKGDGLGGANAADDLVAVGGADMTLASYSSAGVLQWVKKMGGTLDESPTDMTVDANGNIYATGGFKGTVDFAADGVGGSGDRTSLGGTDWFIVKYNSSGVFQWVLNGGEATGDQSGFLGEIALSKDGSAIFITDQFQYNSDFAGDGPGGAGETVAGSLAHFFLSKFEGPAAVVPTTTTVAPTTVAPTTTTVKPTTTTVASTTTVVTATTATTVAVAAAPVVTVAQGQVSVATIAPRVGPTTTVLAPMRSQVPQTTTTTIPPIVKNATGVLAPNAPALAPGEAGAVVNGQKTAATLSRADNQITATAGDITATVSGLNSDGKRVLLNADGNLVVNEGGSLVISATGFAPNSKVVVWMYSTPTQLGVVTAGDDGKASGTFVLPKGLEAGDHRVVLSGENPNGVKALLGLGLSYGTVESGSSITRVLIAIPIALAVLFGLFLPAVTRRRRKRLVAA